MDFDCELEFGNSQSAEDNAIFHGAVDTFYRLFAERAFAGLCVYSKEHMSRQQLNDEHRLGLQFYVEVRCLHLYMQQRIST